MVYGNVLVTGSNRGIGFHIAKALASVPEIQLILAACRSPDDAKDLQQLAKENTKVQILQLDVSSPASIKQAVEAVQAKVGEKGLNLLVNNAGILRHAPSVEKLTAEQMMENYATNTVAPLMLIQALLPLLEKAAALKAISDLQGKNAVVVNISSDFGSLTLLPQNCRSAIDRLGNVLPYNCSKAALNMVTRWLAIEKPEILTVSIHPGWVITDMGGPDAHLTGEQCATSIVKTIQNLKSEHNGGYMNWEGETLPW